MNTTPQSLQHEHHNGHDHEHHHDHGPSDPPTIDPEPLGDGEIALGYAQRMFDRQRTPLPPYGFTVDWEDQPSRHKIYRDTPRLPLPSPFAAMPTVTLDAAAAAATGSGDDDRARPGLDVISAALACYGLDGRRTAPNWNEDSDRKLETRYAVWSRPTPSGGGMYPAESYLAVGNDGPLRAGVYHYATAHHGLDRLAVGSRCDALARATGVAADLYLVGSLRFWKNAFKYNSFSYHVVTQDIGALLASWRFVFGAHGIPLEPVLWFDEAEVSAVIDVDGETEAPFLVVPLGPHDPTSPGRRERLLGVGGASDGRAHDVWEKSGRVRTFPLVDEVHAAALVGTTPRPSPDAAAAGACEAPSVDGDQQDAAAISLPSATSAATDRDLVASLRERHSSFGLFGSRPPLDAADLGWALSVTDKLARTGTDVAPQPRTHAWTRLRVIANHVDGLEQRGYVYDREEHRLTAGEPVDFAELQRHYALTNYNISEVAAIVVVTGRLEPLVRAYGGRGYRMLSMEVGQSAQALYLACTARGLGVGAVLGIDNLTVDALLGIDQTDESSMLFVLLGHERGPQAGYDHAFRHPRRSRSA